MLTHSCISSNVNIIYKYSSTYPTAVHVGYTCTRITVIISEKINKYKLYKIYNSQLKNFTSHQLRIPGVSCVMSMQQCQMTINT